MRVAVLLAVIAVFCAADAQKCALDGLMSSLTKSPLPKLLCFVLFSASAVLGKVTLSCIDVPGSGFEVECPKGYKPTCCSCTNAGCYWDISNDQTCRCECFSVTMNRIGVIARCCKIAM
ncbi:resistin-like beta [Acipenser oxyrinchus oxyrinchus]|uniref:Resistin-like beta n=1 Tax=Acipenser oxyrinchus oxyrinchus TaxID=40147 RepID=A0AAD8CM14_ACIOX|nr:resistin-like beta [Acipenser oxyrinchus oxyrinchus]